MPQRTAIFSVHESKRLSGTPRTARSPDTVQVVFILIRHFEIKDRIDIGYIDTAGGNIRRDQDIELASSEVIHDAVSRTLSDIAMETLRLKSESLDAFRDDTHTGLGIGESHHTAAVISFHDLSKCIHLLSFFEMKDILADLRHIFRLRCDLDLVGAFHIFPGDVHDFTGHRRGEHRDLLVRRSDLHDLSDVLDEAHVEHLVRLVKNERVDVGDVDVLMLHMVKKTPGSRDNDLRFFLQHLYLLIHLLSADDAADLQSLDKSTQSPKFRADLKCQLSCRAEDQGLDEVRVHVQILQDRDTEGEGLTCARRCFCNHTAVIHKQRYCLFLYRGRCLHAHFIQGTHDLLGQIHLFERCVFQFLFLDFRFLFLRHEIDYVIELRAPLLRLKKIIVREDVVLIQDTGLIRYIRHRIISVSIAVIDTH